jgi:hypothetical protein
VFCAETNLFDGTAAYAYAAVPLGHEGGSLSEHIRFKKTAICILRLEMGNFLVQTA